MMKMDFSAELTRVASAAKILAHPARLKILEILMTQSSCVPGDIFEKIPLSRGSINQHLTAMKEAGWVKTTLQGSQIQYCVNQSVFQENMSWVNSWVNQLNKLTPSLGEACVDNCVSPKYTQNSANIMNSIRNETKKQILFLCTGNSCRSQMAEALFNSKNQNITYTAVSAGLAPASEIHPIAQEVLLENGIVFKGQRPKSVSEFLGKTRIDMTISVCSEAEKNCPFVFPFVRKSITRPFEDPAAFVGSKKQTKAKFVEVFDEINGMVSALIQELSVEPEVGAA